MASHNNPSDSGMNPVNLTPEILAQIVNDPYVRNAGGTTAFSPGPEHQPLMDVINKTATMLGMSAPQVVLHNGNISGIAYDMERNALVISDQSLTGWTSEEFGAFVAHELDHHTKEPNAKKMNQWLEKAESQVSFQKAVQIATESLPKFSNFMEFSADDRAIKLYGAEATMSALQKMLVAGAETNNELKATLFPDLTSDKRAELERAAITQRVTDIASRAFPLPEGDNQLSQRFERLRNYSPSQQNTKNPTSRETAMPDNHDIHYRLDTEQQARNLAGALYENSIPGVAFQQDAFGWYVSIPQAEVQAHTLTAYNLRRLNERVNGKMPFSEENDQVLTHTQNRAEADALEQALRARGVKVMAGSDEFGPFVAARASDLIENKITAESLRALNHQVQDLVAMGPGEEVQIYAASLEEAANLEHALREQGIRSTSRGGDSKGLFVTASVNELVKNGYTAAKINALHGQVGGLTHMMKDDSDVRLYGQSREDLVRLEDGLRAKGIATVTPGGDGNGKYIAVPVQELINHGFTAETLRNAQYASSNPDIYEKGVGGGDKGDSDLPRAPKPQSTNTTQDLADKVTVSQQTTDRLPESHPTPHATAVPPVEQEAGELKVISTPAKKRLSTKNISAEDAVIVSENGETGLAVVNKHVATKNTGVSAPVKTELNHQGSETGMSTTKGNATQAPSTKQLNTAQANAEQPTILSTPEPKGRRASTKNVTGEYVDFEDMPKNGQSTTHKAPQVDHAPDANNAGGGRGLPPANDGFTPYEEVSSKLGNGSSRIPRGMTIEGVNPRYKEAPSGLGIAMGAEQWKRIEEREARGEKVSGWDKASALATTGNGALETTGYTLDEMAAANLAKLAPRLERAGGPLVQAALSVPMIVSAYKSHDTMAIGAATWGATGGIAAGLAGQALIPIPGVGFVAGVVVGDGAAKVGGLVNTAMFNKDPHKQEEAKKELHQIGQEYIPGYASLTHANPLSGSIGATVNLGGAAVSSIGHAATALGEVANYGGDKVLQAAEWAKKSSSENLSPWLSVPITVVADLAATTAYPLKVVGKTVEVAGHIVDGAGKTVEYVGHKVQHAGDYVITGLGHTASDIYHHPAKTLSILGDHAQHLAEKMGNGVVNVVKDAGHAIGDAYDKSKQEVLSWFGADTPKKPAVAPAVHAPAAPVQLNDQQIEAQVKAKVQDLGAKGWGHRVGNGDNTVTYEEIAGTLKNHGISLKDLDKNHDGHITSNEITDMLEKLPILSAHEAAHAGKSGGKKTSPAPKTEHHDLPPAAHRDFKDGHYVVKKGDTLFDIARSASDLIAEAHGLLGKDVSNRDVALAVALTIARKNQMSDADMLKPVGINLTLPTAEELKVGMASLKAGILDDKKISYHAEVKGHDVGQLVSLTPTVAPDTKQQTTR